jgi:hypothetical protein
MILYLVDSEVAGFGTDLEIVPWAGFIAGVWGVVGGFVSGCGCAGITHVLEKRGATAQQYRAVAATVTALLALPVSVANLSGAGGVTAWDLVIWLVLPVGVAAAAAGVVGGWIWRRTRPALA